MILFLKHGQFLENNDHQSIKMTAFIQHTSQEIPLIYEEPLIQSQKVFVHDKYESSSPEVEEANLIPKRDKCSEADLLEKVFKNCTSITMSEQKTLDDTFLNRSAQSRSFKATFDNGYKAIITEVSGSNVLKNSGRQLAVKVTIRDTNQPKLVRDRDIIYVKREDKTVGGEAEVFLLDNGLQGEEIGFIDKKFSLLYNKFEVIDDEIRDKVYDIIANRISSDYQILNSDQEEVGFITDNYTNVQNYQIRFPQDSSARQKALLFSSVFLIDMLIA
ncbi:Plscr1 [Acrasis kona]|uniref:Phospholipid scramblase n=1 Tax=Acrasis kona TaxID=1008807 RepID=A0AAW2Z5G5_9EUKA